MARMKDERLPKRAQTKNKEVVEMRKTTAQMGGLPEEEPVNKQRKKKKIEEKGQHQRSMGESNNSSGQLSGE